MIVALEGKAVSNIRDLQTFLEPESVGKTIPVSLIRSGKPVEVNVTIGERRQEVIKKRSKANLASCVSL